MNNYTVVISMEEKQTNPNLQGKYEAGFRFTLEVYDQRDGLTGIGCWTKEAVIKGEPEFRKDGQFYKTLDEVYEMAMLLVGYGADYKGVRVVNNEFTDIWDERVIAHNSTRGEVK